ncbi:glucose/mannose:H+ symporter GlcP [Gracilibacillus boraciitolerans JCM 21714]|uniref:Glucose/mannose:H+ symporter GlcP n=1 Tax=Gracilibacillus boraciitolerans JCM 21714 TaxID=1298598 RepID=W4VPW0_9BACI|nr:MFS transporter [Gracilibacillus boraciitolerans]GAE94794.1 glucose/mannose:H+ symporter GlcP [Gracilibacillus boraciitolerans JCM 21714]
MIFFIVYVGLEISVMNFLPAILVNQVEAATFLATLSVTIFWGGAMVVGRLAAGYLAEWMQYARYLILCCTGTVVFIAILGLATSLWLSYVLIVLIGLMMAGVFGIAIVYATTLLPGSTDKITSILIASGGAGGIFFPLITGSLMDHATTTTVAFVLAGLSILMIVIILIARNYQKQLV